MKKTYIAKFEEGNDVEDILISKSLRSLLDTIENYFSNVQKFYTKKDVYDFVVMNYDSLFVKFEVKNSDILD
jgi:hypothetical protein